MAKIIKNKIHIYQPLAATSHVCCCCKCNM